MEFKYLTNDFYLKYNHNDCPDILLKQNRGYSIMEINMGNNKFGIPIKSNVQHNQSFQIKESSRAKQDENPGLDYRKAVVISKDDYIGDLAFIDRKELDYIIANEDNIISDFNKYIRKFKTFLKSPLLKYKMASIFKFSALKYFLEELDIPEPQIKFKEVLLAERASILFYNIVADIQNDCGENIRDNIRGSIAEFDNKPAMNFSCNGRYFIKNFNLNNMNDYIELKIDSNGEYYTVKGEKYLDVLNEIKLIISCEK